MTVGGLNKVDALNLVGQKFAQLNNLYITHSLTINNLSKREKLCYCIFGAKFVKAIVVESDWHVYTDPHNFNRTDHRSMDVDVIIKENGEYYVSHQLLWQNYRAGSWGSYDMRQKSPVKQKVNYK